MGMDMGDMGDMGMGGGAGTGAMPVGTGWPINAQGRAVERCAAMAEEGARPALRAHRRTHRSTHPQRQLDVCNHCAQAQLMRQRTACPPFAQRGAWSAAIEHDMSSRRRLWHARRTSLGAACGSPALRKRAPLASVSPPRCLNARTTARVRAREATALRPRCCCVTGAAQAGLLGHECAAAAPGRGRAHRRVDNVRRHLHHEPPQRIAGRAPP